MSLTLYGLKTCDTCRKALKALEAAGTPAAFVDVRADGVSSEQLKRWAEAVGWQKLINTKSTTWRSLEPADKADLDEAKALDLLAAHPTLIKRPVLEAGDAIHVGWTKDVQAALLG
ncbi:MAG: arsenate reductase [Pseudomonadota bacterium]